MPNKLVKRLIDGVTPQPSDDVLLWCGEVRGFGIGIKPSGAKTFLIQYRNRRGQSRRLSLGSYGVLTVDQARTLAREHLAAVAHGQDPVRERASMRGSITVAEFCDSYLDEVEAGRIHPRGKAKKASTILNDRSRINRHIKPLLGRRHLDDVARKDVEEMFSSIVAGKTRRDTKTRPRGRSIVKGGVGTAVKAVKLLSTIYGHAVRKDLVTANPCIGIDKPADGRRTRFLNPDEYRRLGAALAVADDLLPVNALD